MARMVSDPSGDAILVGLGEAELAPVQAVGL
jgi:hypothetical protein